MSLSDQRWLVIGHLGMLGSDLIAALADRDVTGIDRLEIDITQINQVRDAVIGYDVVANCAAYTAVDAAEADERAAFAVNAVGPANLARACRESGARLLHVSTDYVFAGEATNPYDEDALPAPRTAYGRTKAAGEWAVRSELPNDHIIFRTAWLYGAHGPNFVRTMINLEATLDTVEVVDDQRGQPTWSGDLAARMVATVDARVPAGTYNATASGETTWFGLARKVFSMLGADPERVIATTSGKFVRPAVRPAYSVLGHSRWDGVGMSPMRDWAVALDAAWPLLVGGG